MKNDDLSLREGVLETHLLHCIDSGWSFVHRKGHAEQVFKNVRDKLDAVVRIKDVSSRVPQLEEMLKQLVDAGWPHVNVLLASDNAKKVFADARRVVETAAAVMKRGDVVTFKVVKDKGDENAVMVLEENPDGGRVLVRHLVDMNLQPTLIYPVSDLKLAAGKYRVHLFQVFRVPFEVEADNQQQAAEIVYMDGGSKLQPCSQPEFAAEVLPDLVIVDPLLPNGEVDYDNVRNIDMRSADDLRKKAQALLEQADEIEGLKSVLSSEKARITVTAMLNGDAIQTEIEAVQVLTDGLKWEDENGFTGAVDDINELSDVEYRSAEEVKRLDPDFGVDSTEAAQTFVEGYAKAAGLDVEADGLDTVLGDLTADLMHLCVANGVDFEDVHRRASMHFEAEVAEAKQSALAGAFGVSDEDVFLAVSRSGVDITMADAVALYSSLNKNDLGRIAKCALDASVDMGEQTLAAQSMIVEILTEKKLIVRDLGGLAHTAPPPVIVDLEATIARIKDEIIADVNSGKVPSACASFAELHDYVDANCYGGFSENAKLDTLIEYFGGRDANEGMPDKLMDYLNGAQNAIDAWIKGGHLKEAITKKDKSGTLECSP